MCRVSRTTSIHIHFNAECRECVGNVGHHDCLVSLNHAYHTLGFSQAYQQGGSEWNFGPQIGHMSQTLTDVYAASLPSDGPEGDVLRVWGYERVSGGVWQAHQP